LAVGNKQFAVINCQLQTANWLSSEQNPEECDATDDDSSTKAGNKIKN
jgi:hypothetical protein